MAVLMEGGWDTLLRGSALMVTSRRSRLAFGCDGTLSLEVAVLERISPSLLQCHWFAVVTGRSALH
jgi:hypothetical protein